MPVGVTGEVYVAGTGPVTFSTCVTLQPTRIARYCFDTNGYYAALGVSPAATRKELREAYQRLGGATSPRLTYIIKQLLDPEVRARYDATPLGSVFLDYDVETYLRRKRVKDVVGLRIQGRHEEADALSECDVAGGGEPIEAVVDTAPSVQEDARTRWPWSYYLRACEGGNTDRLAEWQELLTEAFAHDRHQLHIAVGFSGGMELPWGVSTVGHRLVVFLDPSEPPTEVYARAAASRVVEHAAHPEVTNRVTRALEIKR